MSFDLTQAHRSSLVRAGAGALSPDTRPVTLPGISSAPRSSSFRSSQGGNATRLVVIDSGVSNAAALAASVLPGSAVLNLAPNRDGVQQITQALANRRNLTSLHIVSKGRVGTLMLGRTLLNPNNLGRFSSAIQRWGQSLSNNGNIFLYGSNVAEGSVGESFVRRLGGLTRRAIAASIDQTGGIRGGDWDFEYRTGPIGSGAAFRSAGLAAYRNTLDMGTGLRGEYYGNANLTGLRYTRTDARVSANWGNGAPAGLNPNNFSIRWIGQVEAPTTDTYTFFLRSDDGARLFINGRQVINNWSNPARGEQRGTFFMQAGQRYNIRLEYYERSGPASINFAWANSTQPRQVVPQVRMFPLGPADRSAPTAQLTAPAFEIGGTTPYTFSVTYRDNVAVNSSTIGTGDIRVAGPNGFSQVASLVSVTPSGNGTSHVATYRITPPGGSWGTSDNGNYTISQVARQVADTSGNTRPAGVLGGFTVGIPVDTGGRSFIQFAGDTVVGEGSGVARVEVRRSGNLGRAVTVFYETQVAVGSNAATANADFRPVQGVLTFAPGVARQFIEVPIIDDNIAEADEVLTLTLTNNDAANVTLNPPRTSRVTIIDNDVVQQGRTFNFANFATLTGLKLNGVAAGVGGALRLTPDVTFQNGSAYYTEAVPLEGNTSFRTQFQFRLTGAQGSAGTDGFTFTLQNTEFGLDTLGGTAGELGYGGGGSRSLAVAFDTWDNGEQDINDNNIAIRLNGMMGTQSPATIAAPFDLNSGATYTAWVEYASRSRRLEVYLSTTTTKPGTPALTYEVDLGTLLGNQMYVGFTGATGGASNAHDILNWSFNSTSGGPAMSFAQPTLSIGENGGSALVTVRRNGDLNSAVTAILETLDGTARAGEDYQALTRTIQFAAGQAIQTVNIPIINNSVVEGTESFQVRLRNATGIDLGSPSTMTITITDDDGTIQLAPQTVVGGLSQPTAVDWTRSLDGTGRRLMFIAQKDGVVRAMEGTTLLPTPFIDISAQVNNVADRGLLGIAVHPDLGSGVGRDFVYLLFTYDPPEVNGRTGLAGPDGIGNRPSRLVRVTANAATGFRTALPGSEVVLLGTNSTWAYTSFPDRNSAVFENIPLAPSGIVGADRTINGIRVPDAQIEGTTRNIRDYLATDSDTHSIGFLKFGTDGTLFVSNGDGTSYNGLDPRTTRVQDIDNLSGKILRIDPVTGQGVASNPFFNGDPNSNRSKVFAYGLRNPFRFTIDPRTNTPFIGDVGWGTWEEVNGGPAGSNFGWPFYEGGRGVSEVQGPYSSLPEAPAFYSAVARGDIRVTAPVIGLRHGFPAEGGDGANAVVMGDFYTGSVYPQYNGALFFTDIYGDPQPNLNAAFFNPDGSLREVRTVMQGQNYNVQLVTGPDGFLYYVNLFGGFVGRYVVA